MTVRRQRGFTLMEVLIAVTITAVIGLGVWQVISGVVLSRDRVNEVADEFDQVQRAFLLLERDLHQIVNRPIRNIYGDFEPALSSRDEAFELVLTRQGWRNPLGHKRSELQRSAYELVGEELHRRYWVRVDRGQEESSRDQRVLSEVTELQIRFMDRDRNWQDDWPPDNATAPPAGSDQSPQLPMPLAIEVTLSHRRFGDLARIFTLPDFESDAAQGDLLQAAEPPPQDDQEQLQEPPQEQPQAQEPPAEQTGVPTQ
ncbi:MAG: type II secretion system minor pseudopilin GspJ [Marinobacter sp.]|uniref:type II secretion system minor pseudopilin GspJ n=1 Tax=Marinobacter sp. TaxID=50741 RepID=UPI00299E6D95|nr:type II secretion system minor pseudopilin GspJ [Marinobacter sp.]MDX1634563.1 type II secretion system minor pseudopilin GspJ [Marinobacter sp.]